jgi:hypothetical protein
MRGFVASLLGLEPSAGDPLEGHLHDLLGNDGRGYLGGCRAIVQGGLIYHIFAILSSPQRGFFG